MLDVLEALKQKNMLSKKEIQELQDLRRALLFGIILTVNVYL